MKQHRHTFLTLMVLTAVLFSACRRGVPEESGRTVPADTVREAASDSVPAAAVPEGVAEWRRPDVKVHVRRGQPLAIHTEGLTLTAVDAVVQHDADYSVTSLAEGELPPLPQGMVNLTGSAAGYRLLPGGEHFSPYAELRVGYDPGRLPRGYTPEDIFTSYYDSAGGGWVRLERLEVDTVHCEIVSATTHFTDFINELLKSPEMPETQGFVPTQMSSLEAANPLAGYTTVAPPEANNMGTASLTYPLQVPAGRGGIQPSLALTYNSNGGNGVCGMGWDLPVPCISVETRWGVPLYNANHETETYLLNGEQLLVSYDSLPTFAKAPVVRNKYEYTKRYYPRIEGSFDSILRHGTTPQTYWWEVFDRSGTRYVYGLGDGELRSQQEQAIAKWYLTRVIDRNGNAVRYHYSTDKRGGSGNESGTALYLDKITYAAPEDGFPNTPWYGYCVTFHYGTNRNDPVITGNYGVKENISRRLDSVRTWYVRSEATPRHTEIIIPTKYNKEWERIKDTIYLTQDSVDVLSINSWLNNSDATVQMHRSLIKGYRLLYGTSAVTGKTLLDAVVEMSAEEWEQHGATVQRGHLTPTSQYKYHRFGYRKMPEHRFDTETTILSTEILQAESGLEDIYASPLGGSCSYRTGVNFSLGAGKGCAPHERTLNIEANGNISPKGANEGTTAIIDLNGDGYPDLLFYDEYGEWQCQLFSPENGAYRTADDIVVSLPTHGFSRTITDQDYSIGLGVHAGWEYEVYSLGANIGAQYTSSRSGSTMYFVDVNADGKPDIVKDGEVWFNNSHADTITFGSEYLHYVSPGKPCETSYYTLENTVGLDGSIFEEGHQSQTLVSWIGPESDDSNAMVWTTLAPHSQDTLRRSVVRVWVAPEDGNIQITGAATLDGRFSLARERTDADGVHVSIQHNGDTIPGTCHDLDTNHPTHDFQVQLNGINKGDRIYFRVEALRNDLYDVVEWNPVITYPDKNLTATDNAGRKQYVFSAEDDFLAWQEEMFCMPVKGKVDIVADYKFTGTLQNNLIMSIVKCDSTGSFMSTIASCVLYPSDTPTQGDTLITWRVNQSSIDESNTIQFLVESAADFDRTKLVWMPHVTSASFDDGGDAAFQMHGEDGTPVAIYAIDRYVSPIFTDEIVEDVPGFIDTEIFGRTNHGWGSFVYNSTSMRTPIVENRIKKDVRYQHAEIKKITDSVNARYSPPSGGGSASIPVESVLADVDTLLPNPDNADVASLDAAVESDSTGRILVAFAGKAYVTPTQMGLYNWYSVREAMEDSTLRVPVTNQSIAASGKKAVGPVKGNSQQGFGVHISAGLTCGGEEGQVGNIFGLNACFNYSNGENRLTADYRDFNGDGYPDVISENAAQYTNSWGGLSAKTAGIVPTGRQGIHGTVYNSFSLQGGGSFVNYSKKGKNRGETHVKIRSNGAGVGNDGSVAYSKDHLSHTWMDVNGDGLPDRIDRDSVALNLGYDYYKAEYMHHAPSEKNHSVVNNKSNNLNFSGAREVALVSNSLRSTVNNSFSTGKSFSESVNTGDVVYVDMNGDGLVDKVEDGEKVYYNQGWGFRATADTLDTTARARDISHNIDYSGNLTIGFPLETPAGCFKIQGSAGISIGNSASTTEAVLMDMNADGLPDIVRRVGSSIWVRYNLLYDLDKLVSVQSFYGNHMDIAYGQAPYSAGARQRPTVMRQLTVYDSTGRSDDRRVHRFGYEGYVHPVEERTPYGFTLVADTQFMAGSAYRITRQQYRTDLYKMRGRKAGERVTDAAGRPWVEHVWDYELKRIDSGMVVPLETAHCFGPTWPALDSAVTRYYDPMTQTVRVETAEIYIHTGYGRVAEYVNCNNTTTPDDDVRCFVKYCRRGRNQSALPKEMTVTNASNNILRRRTAGYTDKGLLERLTIYNTLSDSSTVSGYTYDSYGNPRSAELPPNRNGQRAKYIYGYDTLLHQFPTSVTDSAFNMVSRTEYDVRLGLPLRVYSVGGDSISYTYDDWGRPLTIRAPQEYGFHYYPTIQYKYWDGVGPARQINQPGFRTFTGPPVLGGTLSIAPCTAYSGWPLWAQTMHRSQKDTMLNMTTALFADGHGRVLQTCKTAVIDGHNNRQAVSGQITYDDAGRPHVTFDPFEIHGTNFCAYHEPSSHGDVYTRTEYDLLDRVVLTAVYLPGDVLATTHEYSFGTTGGVTCFQTVTRDPESRETLTMADARGLTLLSADALHNTTQFGYDALGQLAYSVDPEGFITSYKYDMQGHVTMRDHPDAGVSEYGYDGMGNLYKEVNPLGEITYAYSYYRLQSKQYTAIGGMDGNDVEYTYGTSGSDRGRPTLIVDGSGSHELRYDALGNVREETRTIALPNNMGEVYHFRMEYDYDSWGRMLWMTYPDGEQVRYSYNRAGDLVAMGGDHTYIQNIRYNVFGQRDSILYGNGTGAAYTYDALHRLKRLLNYEPSGVKMHNISYLYDRVGDIVCFRNDVSSIGPFNGWYRNDPVYDDAHRMVSCTGGNAWGSHELSYAYSPSGRLVNKDHNLPSSALSPSTNMYYGYCDKDKPHAVRRMYDELNHTHYDLRWDSAGNMAQVSVANEFPEFVFGRFLFWDESNRLHAAVDEAHYSYYAYDYGGERRIKITGENISSDVNAYTLSTYANLDNATLYPSAYMVLDNHGYTKHYYAGADRVAARIGGGGLDYLTSVIGYDNGLQQRSQTLYTQSCTDVNNRRTEANKLDCLEQNSFYRNEFGYDIYGVPDRVDANVSVRIYTFQHMVDAMRQVQWDDEGDVFFYHGDHLGSASWITDFSGKPVQHLQYLPYGEPYVDQRNSGYGERFTFTGKERDQETGYGYFGARYMDHELLTSFLSVDRYASKYPSISPYAYCAWNPIKLTDPTGDTIINRYLKYKNREGDNGDLYARTQQIIDEFHASNPEEFEYLNNLSFTDENGVSTPVNIIVGISDERPRVNPETGRKSNAQTFYNYNYYPTDYYDANGNHIIKYDIIGIINNSFSVMMYKGHHDLSSLANELGDVIFAVMRPQTVFEQRKLIYYQQSTTQFSFDYEDYITGKRTTRPDPLDRKKYK